MGTDDMTSAPYGAAASPDAAVSLPRIVGRLAQEIGALVGISDDLQSAVELNSARDAADSRFIASAQGLDFLSQHLEGLHRFVTDLVGLLPETCLVDPSAATEAITLGGLKARLSFSDPGPAASEEVEFF